ncbi:MAG: translesion DNA synthesis-associated protein ImuA [Dokdonella sp.]
MAAVLSEGFPLSMPASLRRGLIPSRSLPANLPRRAAPAGALLGSLRREPTGHAALDAQLPTGGWTRGALTELIARNPMTTLPVVLPALQRLARMRRRIAVIVPSSVPLARALVAADIDERQVVEIDATDAQWSAEQALRDGGFSAVITWLGHADYAQLRRLHIAADSSDSLAFALRPASAINEFGSPAALRMNVNADENGSHLDIIKCRGRRGANFGMITLG